MGALAWEMKGSEAREHVACVGHRAPKVVVHRRPPAVYNNMPSHERLGGGLGHNTAQGSAPGLQWGAGKEAAAGADEAA